jgi:hypothetical protein
LQEPRSFPSDWQVYAHYSGRQSFTKDTKGLLLIDNTAESMRQVLEITSQDCKWKARKGNEEWVVDPVDKLISVPDGSSWPSLSQPCALQHGKSDISVLSLSCRPNHNLNVQMSMNRKSDQQFVDGELKGSRKSLSTLQMSTDSEFRTDSKWQEIGGSEQAARYLQLVDENWTSVALLQSHGCRDADKYWAKEHLGEAYGTESAEFLEDCIYDLCHSAGETQAELAAELLRTTKAN